MIAEIKLFLTKTLKGSILKADLRKPKEGYNGIGQTDNGFPTHGLNSTPGSE
jgi:hypothetical protein